MTDKISKKNTWINLSLLNLMVVAVLGVLLRSKMLFSIPLIHYNQLLDAHAHFAFGGWVTLALLVLMIFELLPPECSKKKVYQRLLGIIFASSWAMLISFYVQANGIFSDIFSGIFILGTYVFGWTFIKDLLKTQRTRAVRVLGFAAVICLVLSSIGPFMLDYLFITKSLNAFLYRDALFAYLHLQYNGFFTLTIFALLFNDIDSSRSHRTNKNIEGFAILLSLSILPSLFQSFLWHEIPLFFKLIAYTGSLLVFLSFICFLVIWNSLKKAYLPAAMIIRAVVFLSMFAFLLKMFLQSFTIFPVVGNAVFGNRPMIIGFLHLVFLGFVSLIILAIYMSKDYLKASNPLSRWSLTFFSTGVILNEGLLFTQGLCAMFSISTPPIPWLLWITSLFLLSGACLTLITRMKYGRVFIDE